jgi:hypothetical protein
MMGEKRKKRGRLIVGIVGIIVLGTCGLCIVGTLLPSDETTANVTAAPTATLSVESQFKRVARSQFGSDLLSAELSKSNGTMVGTTSYEISAVWDEEYLVRMALHDLADFLPNAFAIDGIDVVDLRIGATFEDLYGQESEETAFQFVATRSMVEKVDWEGVDLRDISIILEREAGCDVRVHPALEGAWISYQLK